MQQQIQKQRARQTTRRAHEDIIDLPTTPATDTSDTDELLAEIDEVLGY